MKDFNATRYFNFSFNPLEMERYFIGFLELIQKEFDYDKSEERYYEDFNSKFSFELHIFEDYNCVKLEASPETIEEYSNIFINRIGFVPIKDNLPKKDFSQVVFSFNVTNQDLPSKYEEFILALKKSQDSNN